MFGKARPLRPSIPESSLPFKAGDSATERLGAGEDAPQQTVRIVEIDGDTCLTDSGRYYCRHTGGRIPSFAGEYRALHSLGYTKQG